MDLTDIYKTPHPTTAEYTFFPSTHGTFSRINHMLGHKTSLTFQEVKILLSILNCLQLNINYKGKIESS